MSTSFALVLVTALSVLSSLPAQAGPGRMDTTKRASRVSTEKKAVLPEAVPLERNEVLPDKRFGASVQPRQDALVGERRSAIEITETRDKAEFVTPERPQPEIIERTDSPWAGKESRFSTADDAYRSRVATRFQNKISDASPVTRNVEPVIDKRTTFDRINRFSFRKNAPVSVTIAGSEQAAADAAQSSSPGEAQAPR